MNLEKQKNDYIFFTENIINKGIETFHHHTFLLKTLSDMIENKHIKYLEIGSYHGSSLILLSLLDNVETCIGIDPLVLDNQKQKIESNIEKYANKDKINIVQLYSNDKNIDFNFKFDMIFIDGDHSFQGVINDFLKYQKYLEKDGYICFDDYNDNIYSMEVKNAVDYMSNNNYFKDYEILKDIELFDKVYDSGLNIKKSNIYFIKKLRIN